jgi:hypothetical protein
MTGADPEWQRVSTVRSPVSVVAAHVTGLRLAPEDTVPQWLSSLSVPTGWQVGRLDGLEIAPWRIAVIGRHDDSGWDGCETITVYRFEGAIPVRVLRANAALALRDLEAANIETTALLADDTGTAVRSSGYLAAGGVWIKALHNYLAAEGLLIHQSIFIDTRVEAVLSADVEQLGHSLFTAFAARSA